MIKTGILFVFSLQFYFSYAQINPAYRDSFCTILHSSIQSVFTDVPDTVYMGTSLENLRSLGNIRMQKQLPGGAQMDSLEWSSGQLLFHSTLLTFELDIEGRKKIYGYLKNLLLSCLPGWKSSETRSRTSTDLPFLTFLDSGRNLRLVLYAEQKEKLSQFKLRLE